MLKLLSKIFILSFYRANAGFFLFFFFLFFGAVEGSSLVSYHLSLVHGMLRSGTVLLLVFGCWMMYHLKCTSFFFRQIENAEGRLLVNLQAISSVRQWLLYLAVYVAVYLPVLFYSAFVFFVAIQHGYRVNGSYVVLFQAGSITFFTSLIYYRFTHWLEVLPWPAFWWPFDKGFLLYIFYYIMGEKKTFLLVLKAFSLALLYIILVWNRGRYDNDSFLLFYLVVLLAHATIPYFAVQFQEQRFAVHRNLPVRLLKRGLAFLLPYAILIIPEAGYIFYMGDAISWPAKLGYCVNLLASLSFLTAIQYSDAQSRDEYMKATFALIFISIFMLHVQAFLLWICVQFAIAILLFYNGFYRYEKEVESG